MTKKNNNALTSGEQHGPPVRVRLRRINAGLSKPYPPDGEDKVWWGRLKKALGTTSSDFVDASLLQLQVAAQLHCGGISEVGMNAALALIEAAEPQNEIEGALALQMACTHTAAISVLARFRGGGGSERLVVALASAAARLLRAYSGQVEALRRLRHGGDQYVRVEHVHVNDGGQAVIGNVRPQADDRRVQADNRALLRSGNPGSQDQQPSMGGSTTTGAERPPGRSSIASQADEDGL
jgi:hypothetical protein